ncbi:DUF2878 domain-containing protein [Arenimonas sp.]|uniref:DUF2878 domain-containing protein n=1 Tax=Arenimonas sp. TaxID=1872635 RepID=UPI0039E4C302
MWAKAANAVGFQLVWICCVVGSTRGSAWPGPAAALLFALGMFAFGGKAREDAAAMLLTLPIGVCLDSAFSMSGWLRYAGGDEAGLAPAWIGSLWLAFAFSLNHSLKFLQRLVGLAALLGGVCGPLSYLAAERLGAVEFIAPRSHALALIAVAWALLLPMLFGLLRHASSPPQRTGQPA